MKFKLTKKLLETFPEAVEYIVVAQGINNEIAGKWIFDRTADVGKKLKGSGQGVLDERKYSTWLDAYKKMAEHANFKAKDFLPSHIALTKRLLAGKDLPNINPVVNFYNLYSVEYGVPIGGENMAELYGDLVLDVTEGGEKYVGIGSSSVDVLGADEVVWRDDHSVTCRMWNWRQCERTKLTKHSKDIYFIFDSFAELEGLDLDAVVKAFCEELTKEFGGSCVYGKLSKESPEFKVDYETKDISEVNLGEDLQKQLSGTVDKKQSENTAKRQFMKRRPSPLDLIDETHLSERLSAAVNDVLKGTAYEGDVDLQYVQDSQHGGDVSTTLAMRLSKGLQKPPADVADEVVELLNNDGRMSELFVEITPDKRGFINFGLSDKELVSELIKAVSENETFGSSNAGNKRKILVESPSVNPTKAMHIGHLMNLFIGRSLVRLLEKVGFETEIDNLINDKGIPIFQTLWAILHDGVDLDTENLKPDHVVDKYYVEGKKAYEASKQVKTEVEALLAKWEAGDPEVRAAWEKMVDKAYEGQIQTFKRLNEEMGHQWFESEYYMKGREIVEDYLGKGVVEELPDGAIIGRLEERYGIPDVVLVRKDGTSLYHTQDIFLTLQKIEKFKPWKAIWVVGNEHITHFQRLFALLDALGILSVDNLYHYAYARVMAKGGKAIQSRSGTDLTADGMLDLMHEAGFKVIHERNITVELEDEDKVAEAVGIGALRYAFLSKDPFKSITFDPEEAVSFSGRSGPYIMYAYSRGKSVLRKALGVNVDDYGVSSVINIETSNISITSEGKTLLLKLLQYPETVLIAANNYAPNILAEYLYEVASTFNNFYEKHTIAGAEGDQREFRLALTKLVTTVLRDGLGILGIDVLERM